MKLLNEPSIPSWAARMLVVVCALLLGACSLLNAGSTEPPSFFSLNVAPYEPLLPAIGDARLFPALIISQPRAAAGFDSQRIIYLRNDNQLEYFAHSEWVDTPARMMGPLLASAMQRTGVFGAVVVAPAAASVDLRLETEIIRLQHNFQTRPSRVQFTLSAHLIDAKTRRVLASREFRGETESESETAQGGVAAANQVVQAVLIELSQFIALQTK